MLSGTHTAEQMTRSYPQSPLLPYEVNHSPTVPVGKLLAWTALRIWLCSLPAVLARTLCRSPQCNSDDPTYHGELSLLAKPGEIKLAEFIAS